MKRFLADLSYAAAGALGWLLVQPLRLLSKPRRTLSLEQPRLFADEDWEDADVDRPLVAAMLRDFEGEDIVAVIEGPR